MPKPVVVSNNCEIQDPKGKETTAGGNKEIQKGPEDQIDDV